MSNYYFNRGGISAYWSVSMRIANASSISWLQQDISTLRSHESSNHTTKTRMK